MMITSNYSVLHDDSMWKPVASRAPRKRRTYYHTQISSAKVNPDLDLTGAHGAQCGDY